MQTKLDCALGLDLTVVLGEVSLDLVHQRLQLGLVRVETQSPLTADASLVELAQLQ